MYGGFIRRVFYKAFTLRIKPRLYFCVIELPAVIDLISCSKEGGCRAVEAVRNATGKSCRKHCSRKTVSEFVK